MIVRLPRDDGDFGRVIVFLTQLIRWLVGFIDFPYNTNIPAIHGSYEEMYRYALLSKLQIVIAVSCWHSPLSISITSRSPI